MIYTYPTFGNRLVVIIIYFSLYLVFGFHLRKCLYVIVRHFKGNNVLVTTFYKTIV